MDFTKMSWTWSAFVAASTCFAVSLFSDVASSQAPPELPESIRAEREGLARGGDLGAVVALEALAPDRADALRDDRLGTWLTFVGDARTLPSVEARVTTPPRRYATSGPGAVDGHDPRDAATWIAHAARDARVVMLNEEHRSSRQRAFAHELLGPLHEAGFTHIALETLRHDDAVIRALVERGAPTRDDGFYTADPLLGDLVRRALELGMGVVAYEAVMSECPAEIARDPLARTNWREAEQARHLAEFVASEPDARVIVWCGRHHLSEDRPVDDADAWTPMGGLFAGLTGIDPLTVDLMVMTEHPSDGVEPEVYRAVADALDAPTVFVDGGGVAYSAIDSIDAMVFFPRTVFVGGRPRWTTTGGLREPYPLDVTDLGARPGPGRPLAIEVRVADEESDTIALDRVIWRDDAPPDAMVRRGVDVIVRVVDPDGEVLAAWDVPAGVRERR